MAARPQRGRKSGGKPKKVPLAKGLCPATSLRKDEGKISAHYIDLYLAANGSLYGFCRLHAARCFVSDHQLVNYYLRAAEKKGFLKEEKDDVEPQRAIEN